MSIHYKRREFIKKSALTSFGFYYFPVLGQKIAPSDKVRVAHIGLGGMGNAHLNWFSTLPEVEVAGLCDVDGQHLTDTAHKYIGKYPDRKIILYDDFRNLLEKKDIDAVTIATPDHWHAQIAILAFEAGKDVYGEKPLSYSAREGKLMQDSLNKNKRVFQLGTQIHAGDNYHRVAEIIKSGVLGKIKTVRLWKTGKTPVLKHNGDQEPPSHLNYDMWLGPAPYQPYAPERVHFSYRYFLEYSGGIFQDFWCHIADVVWMSLDPGKLLSVKAKGEKPLEGVADTPEKLNIKYKFSNIDLYWTSEVPDINGTHGMGIGACFEGEKGYLISDYGSRKIFMDGKEMIDFENIPLSIPRSPGHQQNFVDSVKSRIQPESNLEYARKMTLPMHLGLISYRLNKKLKWDALAEAFSKNQKANDLLFRPYRKEWNLIGA